ncbi:MAG: prepilin peptidase [Paracoccaceae bacterium]
MELQALIAATVVMAVLMGLAAWFDLKELRIPNWCVLAVVGLFIVTGLWGLPLDVFAWRFLHGVIVLFIGFGLYSISGGRVGGGDIKLIAALTPFIAGKDVGLVLVVFALLSFAGLMIHRFVRGLLRDRKTGWAALDQKRFFPAGLLLGGTIMIYLGWQLAGHYMSAPS